MDDLRPTEYPLTRPSKTLEALPYRNNPYRNNPYEIAPPPPLPNTPTIIKRKRRRWVAVLIVLIFLAGTGALIYAVSIYSYDLGYTDGQKDGETSGYTQGKTEGNTIGYSNGKTDGYNSGYADGETAGENQSLSDLYDYVKGKDSTGQPCGHTSDQPDYVYFRVYKDNSGSISYNCLL